MSETSAIPFDGLDIHDYSQPLMKLLARVKHSDERTAVFAAIDRYLETVYYPHKYDAAAVTAEEQGLLSAIKPFATLNPHINVLIEDLFTAGMQLRSK